MADFIDRAQAHTEKELAQHIAAARTATADTLNQDGVCHTCGNDVSNDQLFCNSRCAEKRHARTQLRKIRGMVGA